MEVKYSNLEVQTVNPPKVENKNEKKGKINKKVWILLIILFIIEFINLIFFILLKYNIKIYNNLFNRYCYDNIQSQINLNFFILILNVFTYLNIYMNLNENSITKINDIITFFKFYITINYIIQLLIIFLYDRKFLCFYIKPINALERHLGINYNIFALLINIFFNTIFFLFFLFIFFKKKEDLKKQLN